MFVLLLLFLPVFTDSYKVLSAYNSGDYELKLVSTKFFNFTAVHSFAHIGQWLWTTNFYEIFQPSDSRFSPSHWSRSRKKLSNHSA